MLLKAKVSTSVCISRGVRVFTAISAGWISSAVFYTGTADGLCFISRLVSGTWSGIPRSALICCQIFINVMELRPPNDARIFCEGPSDNEPVSLLKPFRVSVDMKKIFNLL